MLRRLRQRKAYLESKRNPSGVVMAYAYEKARRNPTEENLKIAIENHLNLDANLDESVVKSVGLYLDALKVNNPVHVKKYFGRVLEGVRRVQDPERIRRGMKNILANQTDAINESAELTKHQKNAYIHAVEKILNEANALCTYDRVIKNHTMINKRFNTDKLISENVFNEVQSKVYAIKFAELIDTYKLSIEDKYKITLENYFYLLDKYNCDYDRYAVLEAITGYFFVRDTENVLQESFRKIIKHSSVVTEATEEDTNHIDKDFYDDGGNELLRSNIIRTWRALKLNDSVGFKYKEFIVNSTKPEEFALILSKSLVLSDYIRKEIFDLVVTKISSFQEGYDNNQLVAIFRGYVEELERRDMKEYLYVLGELYYSLECDIKGIFTNPSKENLDTVEKVHMEMSFLDTVKSIGVKLDKKLTELSDNEKMASRTFDAAVKNLTSAVTKDTEDNAREEVIADKFIPKASTIIKLAITTGVLYMVAPTLSVIGLFGWWVTRRQASADERRKLMDELDIEINMCNRYLKDAEEKNQLEKIRNLMKIKQKLVREKEKLGYTMVVKHGEAISKSKDEDD